VIQNIEVGAHNASPDFRFASAVAWFGLYLRDSKLIQNKSITDIENLANTAIGQDKDGYRYELIRLVNTFHHN
jgi:Ca-activated chloride channel family protein